MKEILFDCKVTTPMFLAGADGKTPEIRPPSIKAAMRFWWRALNGHLGIDKMKESEVQIFGGSGEKEGRSKFSIKIVETNLKISSKGLPQHFPEAKVKKFNILDYLAFGAVKGDKILRSYYLPGGSFKFKIILKDDDSNLQNELIELVYLISLFGGLGAKSRNGYGRFLIQNDYLDLKTILAKHKNKFTNDVLDFTAFSKDMKLFMLKDEQNEIKEFDNWDSCLAEIGKLYYKTRTSLEMPHQYEKRILIAAPIIQHKRSHIERHSKTYFLCPTYLPKSNKFIGLILFLPYKYLNDYDNVNPRDKASLLQRYENVNTQIEQKFSEVSKRAL